MSEATDRTKHYVNKMVTTLIERFKNKLYSVMPEINEEVLLRNSGIEGINAVMDAVEAADAAVKAAIEAHSSVVDAFQEEFGERIAELMSNACEEQDTDYKEKCDDFEFRIRRAIGEVELVSSEAAFMTLEECRNEINDLS